MAFEQLTDRASSALTDPTWRLATQGAAFTVAQEIITETPQTTGTPPVMTVRASKRRTLANRVMDAPKDPTLTDQFALAMATNLSIGQTTTTAQFLAAVRTAWDTVARVYPEDATTAVPVTP